MICQFLMRWFIKLMIIVAVQLICDMNMWHLHGKNPTFLYFFMRMLNLLGDATFNPVSVGMMLAYGAMPCSKPASMTGKVLVTSLYMNPGTPPDDPLDRLDLECYRYPEYEHLFERAHRMENDQGSRRPAGFDWGWTIPEVKSESKVLQTRSEVECGLFCQRTPTCKGFHFTQGNITCVLYNDM